MKKSRWKWFWLFSVPLILIAGFQAPRYLIDNGISRFASEIEREVAANSIRSAKKAMSNSFSALFARAYRVTFVRPAAEPCDGSPNMFKPAGKYASGVQIYTFFGFPYATVYLTCGGDSWTIDLKD